MYTNNNYQGGGHHSEQSYHHQQQSSGGQFGSVPGGDSSNDAYESRVQVIESDGMGNVRRVEEKREQHSKHTTQTTTTTTSTSAQPTVLINSNELAHTPVHFADHHHQHLSYVQQPVPVYAIAATPCVPIQVMTVASPSPLPPQPLYTTSSGNITVEHYSNAGRFSWTNADTYMHIFVTFYFGAFAAMLFFDGIIRNFVNLYLFEHQNWSMLVFILHIILSIALLAFCVWFLTICWRWWRNKSLLPMYGLPYYEHQHRPLSPKERQATFHGCVFTAAIILLFSFFCYLILGIIELSYKRQLQSHYYSTEANGHYHRAAYIGDLVVFILRLIMWIVGIIITLLLSRDVFFKYCCPERRIKIDKERPTTVYEVRSTPVPVATNTSPSNQTLNTNTNTNTNTSNANAASSSSGNQNNANLNITA